MSCNLLRSGVSTLCCEPGYAGDWGALPGHLFSQAFSHRNFLSTLRFNLLLLFSFLQAKTRKKKGNNNFRRMKFQEMKLKPLTRQRSSAGGSAGDVQKEEVAKLMNKLRETTTLQNRLVKHRFSHTKKWSSAATLIFICSPAAGARCWLARLDNGMFCLIPEQPWLCLQLQPRPLNFPGCPEPLTVLLEGIWEGIPLCATGLQWALLDQNK